MNCCTEAAVCSVVAANIAPSNMLMSTVSVVADHTDSYQMLATPRGQPPRA